MLLIVSQKGITCMYLVKSLDRCIDNGKKLIREFTLEVVLEEGNLPIVKNVQHFQV